MDSPALLIAALAASAAFSDPTITVGTERFATTSPARWSAGGAEATAHVTIRIISQSARIGGAYPAPQEGMTPRASQVAATDGSLVPALVYDFE